MFLDIGSTLVDEEDCVQDRIARFQESFRDSGVSISAMEIRGAIEKAASEHAPATFARALETLPIPKSVRERVQREVGWRSELERPFPDAKAVLTALSERYSLGVIANQSLGSEARLERHGLMSFISHCLASAELGLKKPDPAIFRMALEKADCRPEEAVMVGDRLDNDIRPAKRLGWKTIRIKQGILRGQAARSPDEEPDFEVEELKDILEVLI